MYSSMTQRITSLETSRQFMLNDLLKASDQKPKNQRSIMLIQELLASDKKRQVKELMR